jgi:hypothetical protein
MRLVWWLLRELVSWLRSRMRAAGSDLARLGDHQFAGGSLAGKDWSPHSSTTSIRCRRGSGVAICWEGRPGRGPTWASRTAARREDCSVLGLWTTVSCTSISIRSDAVSPACVERRASSMARTGRLGQLRIAGDRQGSAPASRTRGRSVVAVSCRRAAETRASRAAVPPGRRHAVRTAGRVARRCSR